MALARLNTAALAPMARASVTMAVTVNAGVRRSTRTAYLRSRHSTSTIGSDFMA